MLRALCIVAAAGRGAYYALLFSPGGRPKYDVNMGKSGIIAKVQSFQCGSQECQSPRLRAALTWESARFERTVDLVGPFKLSLHAASTAPDFDWIARDDYDRDILCCLLRRKRAGHV